MTVTKTIQFKVIDVKSINRIMDQQGTLFVEASIESDESGEEYIDYDGVYIMKWSPSCLTTEPYGVSTDQRDEILEIFLNSEFDEGEAFALNEDFLYDLSYFEKYDIPYMVSHDCSRVEFLISLVTKSIVESNITYEV